MSNENTSEIIDNKSSKKQDDVSEGHILRHPPNSNETETDNKSSVLIENTTDEDNRNKINDIVEQNNRINKIESETLLVKHEEQVKATSINNNEVTSLENSTSLVDEVKQLNISDDKSTSDNANNKSEVQVNAESTSLRNLLIYNSEDEISVDMDSDADWQLRAVHSPTSSSSESSQDDDDDDDEEESDDDLEDSSNTGAIKKKEANNKNELKTVGEVGFDELPPVPDISTLTLGLENQEYLHVGHIQNIIDRIVTVESLPNTPAFDLDTLLFFGDEKKPLGYIYDVMGQVTSPIYAIRFNSTQDIASQRVEKGEKVYAIPTGKFTQYVFVKELMKLKGSDASWLGDNELPPDMQEFSDDDAELVAITGRSRFEKPRAQKRPHGSLERHKRFERTMNQCNALNTRVHRLIDAHSRPRHVHRPDVPPQPVGGTPDMTAFQRAAALGFDPRIPPPGFADLSSGAGPNLAGVHGFGYQSSPSRVNFSGRAGAHAMYNTPIPAFNNRTISNAPPCTVVQPPPNNSSFANFMMQNSGNYFTNDASRNYGPGPSYGNP